MFSFKGFLSVTGVVLILFARGDSTKAAVIEDFSSDPIAGGRSIQTTTGTESSFTYNAGSQNLSVVLDYAANDAYYLSKPFPTVTDDNNSLFRMDFRIDGVNNAGSGYSARLGFFGLMTTQNMSMGANGLGAEFGFWDNQVTVRPRLKTSSGYVAYEGGEITLGLSTDYRLLGSYDALSRSVKLQVFAGSTLIGTTQSGSIPGYSALAVDRIGFHNYQVGTDNCPLSIALTVDNISNVPEPSTLTLLATGLASLLFMAWRRRKRS